MSRSRYRPFVPAARPGGRPAARPLYRVLVHRQYANEWAQLVNRVGVESARQFYDHVAQTPGSPPLVGRSSILRGRLGEPQAPGFSRTIHYEISGAGRLDYQYNPAYVIASGDDPHPIVRILSITFESH